LSVLFLVATAIRLEEPYVRMSIKKSFFPAKITNKGTIKLSSEGLSSFINSAMNIEFVCLILEGVRGFNNFNQLNLTRLKSIVTLKSIELDDIEKWDVDNNN